MTLLKSRIGRLRDNYTPLAGPVYLYRWAVWFALLFLLVVIGGYVLLDGHPWESWLVTRIIWGMVVGLGLLDLVRRLRVTHYAVEFEPGIEHYVKASLRKKLFYVECGWSWRLISLPIPVWLLAWFLAWSAAREMRWHWPDWGG